MQDEHDESEAQAEAALRSILDRHERVAARTIRESNSNTEADGIKRDAGRFMLQRIADTRSMLTTGKPLVECMHHHLMTITRLDYTTTTGDMRGIDVDVPELPALEGE